MSVCLDIHFIHLRSPHAEAIPLVITHGWPGLVAGFAKVTEPLADPVADGGTRPTRSTWSARRYRASGSAASQRAPDGARSTSPTRGIT
jgi:hypothetical protein